MSAIVCGKRSSFFDELQSQSPPVSSKRIRCSSSSPVRYSPPRPTNTAAGSPTSSNFQSPFNSSSHSLALDQLIAFFPDMDKQLLERALEACGDDLDSAIRSLNELRLGSAENLGLSTGKLASDAKAASSEDPSVPQNSTLDGADWVELFVKEMINASNIDDAKARASKALEVLEKSICARVTAEADQSFHQGNVMLKQQLEVLLQENNVLKRAVSIQHERQKEFEDKSQELQHLKQLVAQYQEQLRTLEVNNYALTLHLKQAQQSSSIPGRFNPDVF